MEKDDKDRAIEKAVVDAVKEAVAETAKISHGLVSAESLLEKINTQFIVQKALEQVNIKKSAGTSVKSPEKKKLYLPPHNAPNYNPTPICELNRKQDINKGDASPVPQYSPTKNERTEVCDESESDGATFSTDEDVSEEDEESKKEFDMFEEILAEQLSNPERAKVIKLRKQELAKKRLKQKNLGRLDTKNTSEEPSDVGQQKSDETDMKATLSSPKPVEKTDYFLPPSPVFTQSTFSYRMTDSTNLEDDSTRSVSYSNSGTSSSCSYNSALSSKPYLDRPCTEAWLPKSTTPESCEMVSVESMLAKLDGACSPSQNYAVGDDITAKESSQISNSELSHLLSSPARPKKSSNDFLSGEEDIPIHTNNIIQTKAVQIAETQNSQSARHQLSVAAVSLEVGQNSRLRGSNYLEKLKCQTLGGDKFSANDAGSLKRKVDFLGEDLQSAQKCPKLDENVNSDNRNVRSDEEVMIKVKEEPFSPAIDGHQETQLEFGSSIGPIFSPPHEPLISTANIKKEKDSQISIFDMVEKHLSELNNFPHTASHIIKSEPSGEMCLSEKNIPQVTSNSSSFLPSTSIKEEKLDNSSTCDSIPNSIRSEKESSVRRRSSEGSGKHKTYECSSRKSKHSETRHRSTSSKSKPSSSSAKPHHNKSNLSSRSEHKDKKSKHSSSSHHRSSSKSSHNSHKSSKSSNEDRKRSRDKNKVESSSGKFEQTNRGHISDGKLREKRHRDESTSSSKSSNHLSRSKQHKYHKSSRKREGSGSKSNKPSKKDAVPGDSASLPVLISDEDAGTDSTGSPLPDLSALDDILKDDIDEIFMAIGDQQSEADKPPASPAAWSDTDDNNEDVEEQCRQIYQAYESNTKLEAPVKTTPKLVEKKKKIEEPVSVGKKRVSRVTAEKPVHRELVVKSGRKSATQHMMERYKKLQEEQKALERKMAEQEKLLQAIAKNSSLSSPNNILSTSTSPALSSSRVSSTSEIGSFSSPVRGPKKRIARPPSNVHQLLSDKNRVLDPYRKRTALAAMLAEPEETIAKCNPKGARRIAHVPKLETLTKPLITSGTGKVPQAVRQRYLDTFVTEATKFCYNTKMAHDVAIAEEELCHNRAANRNLYLNLAVNTVKRLRSQKISDSVKEKLQDIAVNEAGPSSSNTSSPKSKSSHPVNPNHRTCSHFAVLGQGGQKGSWSIEKKKSSVTNFDEMVKGTQLLEYLKEYIMTPEQLNENGYPSPHPKQKGKAIIKCIDKRKKICDDPNKRICARCSTTYSVDDFGVAVLPEKCVYHWRRPFKTRNFNVIVNTYPCCQSESSSDGCSQADTHVSDNFDPNGLDGFVQTFSKKKTPDVYALDCEMCYTTGGNELTRITVINSKKETVYDTLVLPDRPILDYNTRFSGITAEMLKDVKVSIQDVQAYLLSLFCNKTILIGHSLESDLFALKMIHETVIDTSVVFPHTLGPPRKRALKHLASEYLKKIIQDDLEGHDSTEDALTCMELMHYKVKEDLKTKTMSFPTKQKKSIL